ncbi:MAG: TrmB family transcriptional regulator [Halococcoides sp.]
MTESLREALTRWGFSDAEVNVYLAALEAGQAPASEVADVADVSRRHVYRISERLEEVGLVDVRDQYQPTLIRATPSEEVAEIMQRRQETIVSGIDEHRGGPEEPVGGVEVIKHMATVFDRCRSMLAGAEDIAFLTAPPDLVDRLAEDLQAARDRGVTVLVFTKDVADPPGQPLDRIASVVRVREDFELFHQFALAVDHFRALVGTPEAMDHHADERFGPALYVEGEYVTPRISASFIEYEWKLGVERVVPEPAALPATFEGFTPAVVHAVLHRREGTDLHATAVVRPTDADDPGREDRTTIEGRVVEVRQGIVDPYRKSFLYEQSMTLDTGEREVTVAGPGAMFEDYVATKVTLERGPDGES